MSRPWNLLREAGRSSGKARARTRLDLQFVARPVASAQVRKKDVLLDKYRAVNVRRHDDVGIKGLFRGTYECRRRVKNRAMEKRRDVTNDSLCYRAEIRLDDSWNIALIMGRN